MSENDNLADRWRVAMSENDNLAIWNSVCETDYRYTQRQQHGAGFTTVDAQYQCLQATRLFGPYGKGWGIRNVQYHIQDLYVDRRRRGPNREQVEESGPRPQMIMKGTFYWYEDGVEHEIEMVVDLPFKEGQDTAKKCLTMIQSKALSKLGFAADVYMGKFDDDAYVQTAKIVATAKGAEEEEHRLAKQREGADSNALRACKNVKSTQEAWEMQERIERAVADGRLSDVGYAAAFAALQERFAELKGTPEK